MLDPIGSHAHFTFVCLIIYSKVPGENHPCRALDHGNLPRVQPTFLVRHIGFWEPTQILLGCLQGDRQAE
jgi:hypothetical protein